MNFRSWHSIRKRLGRIGFLWLILTFAATAGVSAEQVYSFGIVPQQSASKLASLWGPLIAAISRESGLTVHFATAPDIPTFEKRLAAGEYDFAYMNPYHYTVFHQAPGYQALAKDRDKRIRGIIVVRKDSPFEELKDLEQRTLAFPAPAAFAASMLTRSELRAQRISFTPKYVSSHDSVYRAVAKGLYPAGGGVERTFNNVAPQIREQLRILWTSRGYTPHAIAYHPRVGQGNAMKLQRALINLDRDPTGTNLLNNINIKGFGRAVDADWNDVRELKLKLLSDL